MDCKSIQSNQKEQVIGENSINLTGIPQETSTQNFSSNPLLAQNSSVSSSTTIATTAPKPCFQQIQVIFNKFLEYIKTMRWTIAFIADQFEYSPTRMGEILKLKNIKNGKRKFREWTKLSDRMVAIMSNRSLTMEYELLFQQFQGDFMKNGKKVKRRRQMISSIK